MNPPDDTQSPVVVTHGQHVSRVVKPLLSSLLVVSLGCGAPLDGGLDAEELDSQSAALDEVIGLEDALAPGAALLADDQFVLTQAEWFTIQRYAQNALALPRTESAMRLFLSLDAADSYAPFQPLTERFVEVHGHAYEWDSQLYPETVDLAGDLVNYAETAQVFYQPLIDAIALLRDSDKSNDASANQDIIDISRYLAEEASYYEERAQQVEEGLHAFGTTMTEDHGNLALLYQGYLTQYGETDGEIGRLRKQIEDLQKQLDQAHKDYDHYVTVAATTPTYAWIPGFGLWAAIGVAGSYGKMATDALNLIHEIENKMTALNANVSKHERLLSGLHLADIGANSMAESIASAIPAVAKIRAHWQIMRGDLEQVVNIMTNDIVRVPAVIKKGNVQRALNEWEQVGTAAQKYMKNAYIQVQAQP